MSRIFTREQFYDLVWSKPMTHLAKEFALSDVALHKVARKHDIPNPPPGWWGKEVGSQEGQTDSLPKGRPGSADGIVIAGGELRCEDHEIVSIREQARIKASSAPAAPQQPHPVVDRTIAKLRKAKPGLTNLRVSRRQRPHQMRGRTILRRSAGGSPRLDSCGRPPAGLQACRRRRLGTLCRRRRFRRLLGVRNGQAREARADRKGASRAGEVGTKSSTSPAWR